MPTARSSTCSADKHTNQFSHNMPSRSKLTSSAGVSRGFPFLPFVATLLSGFSSLSDRSFSIYQSSSSPPRALISRLKTSSRFPEPSDSFDEIDPVGLAEGTLFGTVEDGSAAGAGSWTGFSCPVAAKYACDGFLGSLDFRAISRRVDAQSKSEEDGANRVREQGEVRLKVKLSYSLCSTLYTCIEVQLGALDNFWLPRARSMPALISTCAIHRANLDAMTAINQMNHGS